MRATSKATVNKARRLRRVMTPPEAALWRVLRARPGGLKFRRQHPIGPYVVDFYCREAKLAIEVDGIAHEMGGNPERDARRDLALGERGLRIVRIPAKDVLSDLEAVARHIVGCCKPLHQPAAGPPPHAFGAGRIGG